MTLQREVISIFVDNQSNVLTRVVSLFRKKRIQHRLVDVSATNDPSISRITVVFYGSEQSLAQIIAQTENWKW